MVFVSDWRVKRREKQRKEARREWTRSRFSNEEKKNVVFTV
jgi:hypothetical protein